jgi:uncharacterized protein (TIGR03032 family)
MAMVSAQGTDLSRVNHMETASEKGQPELEIAGSRQFSSWLAEQRASVAFTTYQAGKLFLVGLQESGQLSIFERTFSRCMGLCTHFSANTLWMSSLYQLWRFENALPAERSHEGYDRLYVPQVGYTTGDLDIHDIAVDKNGNVIFVNTLFSCLATTSDRQSFEPLWRPAFITKLAAEDRCHLNGLAMVDGKPAYVTVVSESDAAGGWRDHRTDGGCVIDVESGEIVLQGLSMPHSPRVYQGKLWLLNSGTGEFGWVDPEKGVFEPVAFCPGYARGLAFVGAFAVIGASKPRDEVSFRGLELDDRLKTKKTESRCGLFIVDLRTGDCVHWLRLDGIVKELYDVVVLEDVIRPMALGFKSDEIRRTITIGERETID